MKRAGFTICALTALAFQSVATYAQQSLTVGDLLDRGGKKLTKDEARKLYSGATVSGVQGGNFPNTTFTNAFSANGTVNGDAWNKGTWFTKISGTWTVNDLGQICQDLVNSQGGKIVGCSYQYILGNVYYAARSDARSEAVMERQISR